MTSAAGFQLLAQSLGQVRFLLTKLDDQIQAGLAADPHNEFLLDFEDTVTNRILETNHAIKVAYQRGTLLSSDESAPSHQHAMESSQSGKRTFQSAA